MRRALGAGLLFLLSCRRDDAARVAPPADPPPKPPEYANPTSEQLTRKARSEARLQSEGIAVNPHLPVVESVAGAHFRSNDAVVDRAIALTIVAVKGEGLDQETVDKIRANYLADGFFSPKEKAFILDVTPSQRDRAQFAWRYEGLGVMHWALGYVPQLETPSKIVDAGQMVKIIKSAGATKYREGARLRPTAEILDQADLIYREDWACVDSRVHGRKAPDGIDCEIVVERHHALNWLIGYQNQAWDDVSTDT